MGDRARASDRGERLLVGSLAFVVLAGCPKQPELPGATPAAEPEAAAPPAPVSEVEDAGEPPLVDLCYQANKDVVCALHADGRVSCAHVDDDKFGPPLEDVESTVEIACGLNSMYARDESGGVAYFDGNGRVGVIEELPVVRSLVPDSDCAVIFTGELYCWDSYYYYAMPAPLPSVDDLYADRVRNGELTDLSRVVVGSGIEWSACALQERGTLWCWDWDHALPFDIGKPSGVKRNDWGEETVFWLPRVVTELGWETATDVSRFQITEQSLCWELPSGWMCMDDRSRPPRPTPTCESHGCICEFAGVYSSASCRVSAAAEAVAAGEPNVARISDVVRNAGTCVLDREGRVWCNHESLHEVVLSR